MTQYGNIKPALYRGCVCEFCDAEFETENTGGRPLACSACTDILRAVAQGRQAELPPQFLFPLADANPVSCGNRHDLPKRDRAHDWRYLGFDPRHTETGFEELHVFACAVCGRDRQTARAPAA